MPSTGDFAIPYPAGTDEPDVPADVQALAARVAAVLSGSAINRPAQFQRAADPNPVTVLPGSPADDEIVIYRVDSVTDWRLIWDSVNSRWKKIGGPPLFGYHPDVILFSHGGPSINLPPRLTAPRAGLYSGRWGVTLWSATGDGYMASVLSKGGTHYVAGGTDVSHSPGFRSIGVNGFVIPHGTDRFSLAAGEYIDVRVAGTNTYNWSSMRWLELDPVYLT